MSASQDGVTVDMQVEKIQVCANDSATITAHTKVSAAGQDQSDCATNGPLAVTCANISAFGEPDDASCQRLEQCPGSSKLCEVWTIKSSSSRANMLNSMSVSVANALNPAMTLALADDTVTTIYFLNGTNQVVAEKQSQAGLSVEVTYDSWDTTTEVASDQFEVPTEWEPCDTADENSEIQV